MKRTFLAFLLAAAAPAAVPLNQPLHQGSITLYVGQMHAGPLALPQYAVSVSTTESGISAFKITLTCSTNGNQNAFQQAVPRLAGFSTAVITTGFNCLLDTVLVEQMTTASSEEFK